MEGVSGLLPANGEVRLLAAVRATFPRSNGQSMLDPSRHPDRGAWEAAGWIEVYLFPSSGGIPARTKAV
jgi:hypothetical protein